MSHNHTAAFDYPLGRLSDEANFIVSRENSRIATEAALLQQAVTGILSKEGRSAFRKQLDALAVDFEPTLGEFEE